MSYIPPKTNGLVKTPKPALWNHPEPESTRMAGFMQRVNQKYNLKLKTYDNLYKWSIDHLGEFWEEVWDVCGIVAERRFTEVSEGWFIQGHVHTRHSCS